MSLDAAVGIVEAIELVGVTDAGYEVAEVFDVKRLVFNLGFVEVAGTLMQVEVHCQVSVVEVERTPPLPFGLVVAERHHVVLVAQPLDVLPEEAQNLLEGSRAIWTPLVIQHLELFSGLG